MTHPDSRRCVPCVKVIAAVDEGDDEPYYFRSNYVWPLCLVLLCWVAVHSYLRTDYWPARRRTFRGKDGIKQTNDQDKK